MAADVHATRLQGLVVAVVLCTACDDDARHGDVDLAATAGATHSGAGAAAVDAAVRAAPPAAAAPRRAITLRFQPEVDGQPFACGQSFTGIGKTRISVVPADFRFFVQDVKLIDDQGLEVPVELDERSPWQTKDVALLDFEDQSGGCVGNSPTNDRITGSVPPGSYHGVVFTNGVPEALNHEDPAKYPAPLQASDLTWSWLTGFKFFLAELRAAAPGAAAVDGSQALPGIGLMHVGSRQCTKSAGTTQCARSSRNQVRLADFDPDAQVIVADIARVFDETDLTHDTQCHSADESCASMFEQLGIDWASGDASDVQRVYRVE